MHVKPYQFLAMCLSMEQLKATNEYTKIWATLVSMQTSGHYMSIKEKPEMQSGMQKQWCNTAVSETLSMICTPPLLFHPMEYFALFFHKWSCMHIGHVVMVVVMHAYFFFLFLFFSIYVWCPPSCLSIVLVIKHLVKLWRVSLISTGMLLNNCVLYSEDD